MKLFKDLNRMKYYYDKINFFCYPELSTGTLSFQAYSSQKHSLQNKYCSFYLYYLFFFVSLIILILQVTSFITPVTKYILHYHLEKTIVYQ